MTNTAMSGQYQLFNPLRAEEYEALRADIAKRGVLVPVELDEDGHILDGHHRVRACNELGIDYPTVVRAGLDEGGKFEHVLKMNLLRRHLTPVEWGKAFARLLEAKGVERGPGTRNDKTGATVAQVAEEVGVSKRTAYDRLALAEAADKDPEFAIELSGEPDKASHRKLRQRRKDEKRKAKAEAIKAEPPPLPTGPFRVIVIDPPWHYDKRPEDDTHRARLPYPSLSIDEIKALDVPKWAEDDSIVWLWTTNAHMHDAYHILEHWEYQPKTVLTWAKNRMGAGDWLRGQTEHCILAVRGRPIVTLTNQTTFLSAPASDHSTKPDAFYEIVESLCPGSKLEMFARRPRPGWEAHGDEA